LPTADCRLKIHGLPIGDCRLTDWGLSSVAVPWVQAKVMLYFLYVNIVFHEAVNGPIVVPPAVGPQPIDAVFADKIENDPIIAAAVEKIKKLTEILGTT